MGNFGLAPRSRRCAYDYGFDPAQKCGFVHFGSLGRDDSVSMSRPALRERASCLSEETGSCLETITLPVPIRVTSVSLLPALAGRFRRSLRSKRAQQPAEALDGSFDLPWASLAVGTVLKIPINTHTRVALDRISVLRRSGNRHVLWSTKGPQRRRR
jgi:hypothetical protein